MLFGDPFGVDLENPKASQALPKTSPKPPKINAKTMSKNTSFFNTYLYRLFSIFDLKIHAFLVPSCTHFSSKCQKCKSLKISIFLRESLFSRFRASKKHEKCEKIFKNEGSKKTSKKGTPKIDFGSHFGLQKPAKIREIRKKKWQQEPNKKTCLSKGTGRAIMCKSC